MRKLLLLSTVAAAGVFAATPAAAQFGVSIGYGYPSYGYGYSIYSYAYPRYRSYSYAYPSYGYSYGSNYCKPRRHHRDGMVWYTRRC